MLSNMKLNTPFTELIFLDEGSENSKAKILGRDNA